MQNLPWPKRGHCGIEPVKVLLESLFQRLGLKDRPFQFFHSASSSELDTFWNVILHVESSLTRSDTRATVLKEKTALKAFLEHCCLERHYMFCFKKCGKPACTICSPPRLPSHMFQQLHFLPDPVPDISKEHFLPFTELYGTKTSEHLPFLQERSTSGSHGIPFNPTSQHASNTCQAMLCTECGKQRVVYAARKLKYDEMEKLSKLIRLHHYSCGSLLQDIDCNAKNQEQAKSTQTQAEFDGFL